MEEAIASPVVVSRTVDALYVAFAIDVSSIEQLVIVVARLSPASHIRSNIVQIAEAAREVDMSRVV